MCLGKFYIIRSQEKYLNQNRARNPEVPRFESRFRFKYLSWDLIIQLLDKTDCKHLILVYYIYQMIFTYRDGEFMCLCVCVCMCVCAYLYQIDNYFIDNTVARHFNMTIWEKVKFTNVYLWNIEIMNHHDDYRIMNLYDEVHIWTRVIFYCKYEIVAPLNKLCLF